ncbi:hypothetical protein HDU67_003913 [Dinochytrium kinnereticum]|nr:hypothetical protein HDU67_003913 [Dinochytrium kinnereticum]
MRSKKKLTQPDQRAVERFTVDTRYHARLSHACVNQRPSLTPRPIIMLAIADIAKRRPLLATLASVVLPVILARIGVWPFALILLAYRKKKVAAARDLLLEKHYDYIIVGAGSAGCAIANRLSEDPAVSVLLVEAGGNGLKDPNINTPLLFSQTQETGRDWQDLTIRQPDTRNRVHYWPRGRVLGGCSSVNAVIYVRGNKKDYDRWETEHGCTGWGFWNVERYFRRMEGCEIDERELDKDVHGRDGPLKVSRTTRGEPVAMTNLFVEACQKVGMGKADRYKKDAKGRIVGVDYNGEDQYGAAVTQVTVSKGVRCDTATGYLAPHMTPGTKTHRPNLTILTDMMVVRLVHDEAPDSKGKRRVKGIAVWRVDERNQRVFGEAERVVVARREVVVACGAVNSPKLLMLSGIGPRDHLESLGIPITKALPGVGENLRDHLCVGVSRQDLTKSVYSVNAKTILKGLFDYTFFKRGLFSCGGVEAIAFLNVDEEGDEGRHGQPDMQLHLISISVEGKQADKLRLDTWQPAPIDPTNPSAHNPQESFTHSLPSLQGTLPGPMISIAPTLLHPKSTGRITLASSHPADKPVIDPRYLSHPGDVETLVGGCRIAKMVFKEMERLKPGCVGAEGVDVGLAREVKRVLGDGCVGEREEELYLREIVRRSAVTLYHPVGTCKMGPESDPMAVVTPSDLKVHGFSNLRVADASVMPTLVSGNTNAPAVLVGEVCADMILGRFLVPGKGM